MHPHSKTCLEHGIDGNIMALLYNLQKKKKCHNTFGSTIVSPSNIITIPWNFHTILLPWYVQNIMLLQRATTECMCMCSHVLSGTDHLKMPRKHGNTIVFIWKAKVLQPILWYLRGTCPKPWHFFQYCGLKSQMKDSSRALDGCWCVCIRPVYPSLIESNRTSYLNIILNIFISPKRVAKYWRVVFMEACDK